VADTPVANPLTPLERLGGWLFARRSWIPAPLLVVLLLVPASPGQNLGSWAAGLGLIAGGEWLRLWGVRHIGVVSRTRSDRLGPLITTGPFARTRNPLYLGNIALWAGFAVCLARPWLAVGIAAALALEYHAIVRWEERLLSTRRGEEYARYMKQVPRWIPHGGRAPVPYAEPSAVRSRYSWRATLFSERGTLIAIGAGLVLLWLKAWR